MPSHVQRAGPAAGAEPEAGHEEAVHETGTLQLQDRGWRSEHPVNLRVSIPLLFGRYYVTLVAGKERRSAARRAVERRKHPVAVPGNAILLLVLGILCGLAGLSLVQFASVYILKETGIMVVPQ